jgi:UPF0755 protein
VVFAILGVIVLVVVAVVVWYEVESSGSGTGRAEIVQINQGEGVSSVATSLSAKGVIGSTLAFRLYDLLNGSPTVTPGTYLFHQNSSFSEVHATLNGGSNVSTLDVLPGFTIHEIAERVGDLPGHNGANFQQLATNGSVRSTFSPPGNNNLEGLVASGTYLVLPDESNLTLLQAMVARQEHEAAVVGLNTKSAAALGQTPYQVIIAASIVQKEGYYDKNMPKVARVIYNRLSSGTPLQMDSTVLYALGQDGGSVTSQDLKLQSPYNSYLNTGLPPTPICTPSQVALAAAVHPPPGAWLYFEVVDKSGDEAFADTFAEQLANEKLAQARGLG